MKISEETLRYLSRGNRAPRQRSLGQGATEVCMQGGIHPDYTGQTYLDIVTTVKRAAPDIHVHAFSPLEVWQGAATLEVSLKEFYAALKWQDSAPYPALQQRFCTTRSANRSVPTNSTQRSGWKSCGPRTKSASNLPRPSCSGMLIDPSTGQPTFTPSESCRMQAEALLNLSRCPTSQQRRPCTEKENQDGADAT